MRWFWIDRFEEFVSGRHAVAIKNVTLAEEYLAGYLPGFPIMPYSLNLEGMAQTAGMLVGEMSGFRMRLVLAKVSHVAFHFPARPGDTLRYQARVLQAGDAGARLSTTSHVAGNLQASAEFFLAMLPRQHEAEQLFDPREFARLLTVLRVFEVATSDDGRPLTIPAELQVEEHRG